MKILLTAVAPVLLAGATAPAAAQDVEPDEAELAELAEMMQSLYAADPLTPEQEARLPHAVAVVDQIMPEGIYAQMMEQTMGQVLDPLMTILPQSMPPAEMAATLGVDEAELEVLPEEEMAEVGSLIDPVFAERSSAGIDYMMDRIIELTLEFEPGMKAGLAKAYATRFSTAELEDIAEFFATPTGARYASESMLVFTDPQTMAGVAEAMPAMMKAMPGIMEGMQHALEDFPPPRTFADLSASERSRLAELLGMTETDLEQAMASAQGEQE